MDVAAAETGVTLREKSWRGLAGHRLCAARYNRQFDQPGSP
jgi:hypothetical protein